MTDEPADFDYASEEQSAWKENHGGILLALTVAIILLGCGVITYRQVRFVKPEFPSSDVFPDPPESTRFVPLSDGGSSHGISSVRPDPVANYITVTVTGAASDRGAMMLAIYESSETFNQPEKTELKGYSLIINGTTRIQLPLDSLPSEFAIAAYHDENGDGMLNKSPFGSPTEKYGFSNQAREIIGIPPYHKAAIKRPEKNSDVAIVVE